MSLKAFTYVERLRKIKSQIQLKRELSQRILDQFPVPQNGPQETFFHCTADIAIYGGSAGAGKSLACLIDAAKFLEIPGYRAILFRRTYPELTDVGALVDTSKEFYPIKGGEFLESKLLWRFPNNCEITFGHIQYDKDLQRRHGSQFPRLYFDELTTFTEKQFWYLLSRCRTTLPITPQVRATCNPDATSWVRDLLDSGGYLGEDGFPKDGGKIRYFVRNGSSLAWGDSAEELGDRFPNSIPKSFTFIPAKIQDNPILLEKDPAYLANLHAQHPVDRARLLDGNWNATFEEGTVFNPSWFESIENAGAGFTVRFWDLAASTAKTGFYTAGVKMRRVGDSFVVLDIQYKKFDPVFVPKFIAATAQQDGEAVFVHWEQEPGATGKIANTTISEALRQTGLTLKAGAIAPKGDKLTRSIPYATAAERGRVKLLNADWNNVYRNSLQKFDGSMKPLVNDLTDASTGAYFILSKVNTVNKGTLIY